MPFSDRSNCSIIRQFGARIVPGHSFFRIGGNFAIATNFQPRRTETKAVFGCKTALKPIWNEGFKDVDAHPCPSSFTFSADLQMQYFFHLSVIFFPDRRR